MYFTRASRIPHVLRFEHVLLTYLSRASRVFLHAFHASHVFLAHFSRAYVSTVPPKFVTLPQNVSIDEGKPLTLECEAGGFPFPHITWFLNDTRLPVNGSILDVLNSRKESDEGTYRCTAESSAGSANATAFVTIKGKFKLLKRLQHNILQ